jgi:hypothetical protein
MADRVRRAFSLVGRWEIVRMHVLRASDVSNPSTIPETAMGEVSVLVESDLGGYGHFDVSPGGAIVGAGEARYQYRIRAGTTAFSWGPVSLPIGGVAMLNEDDGVRAFTLAGTADLSGRTISLKAFQPAGGPLRMIIRPGGGPFTVPTWPPMTGVETKVLVQGSSLLLRASGVLSGIEVSFEAVKYVDLMPLLTSLDFLMGSSTPGASGRDGAPGRQGSSGASGAPGNDGAQAGGTGAMTLGGTITIPLGGSALVVFRTPLPDQTYAVALTPMGTGTQGTITSYSEKTPAGFKAHATKAGAASGSITVDWVAVPFQ